MAQWSFADLERLWISNGGNPVVAPVAAAVALAESSGNDQSLNNNPGTGDYSVGLWQINYYGNLAPSRTAQYGSPQDLLDNANAQAKAAVAISGNGTNWAPWTTYTSGAYQAYLPGGSGSASNTGTGATLTAARTAGGGQAGAPYTPSNVPGVPASPPPFPDFTANPANELGRVFSWVTEFGAWAVFTFIILLFGFLLLALGAVLLLTILAGPAISPVADVVGGGIVGRATKRVAGSGRSAASDAGATETPEIEGEHIARGRHAPGASGRVRSTEAVRSHRAMVDREEREERAQATDNAPVRRAHSQRERRESSARRRQPSRDRSQLTKQRAG